MKEGVRGLSRGREACSLVCYSYEMNSRGHDARELRVQTFQPGLLGLRDSVSYWRDEHGSRSIK